MSELVVMVKNKIYTTSLIISENLDVKHDHVVKLLKNYSHIENLSRFEIQKLSTKGRAIVNYLLTEEQALLLVSLMKNTPKVIDFKVKLVRAFIHYRNFTHKVLQEKGSSHYISQREQSKHVRRDKTDAIQDFIEYAIKQGSKNALKYFANISKMQNKALFILEQEVKNVRELLDYKQLALIQTADQAVIHALEEGMEKGIHYKEIYKLARERVEMIAKIIPPSPLAFLASADK